MIASIPIQPEQRRLILVLDTTGWDTLIRQGDREGLLLNPSVTVLKLSNNHTPSELERDLRHKRLLEPGAVLGQSPYETENYWRIEDAKVKASLQKHTYFVQFCQALGARRVQVTEIHQSCRDANLTIALAASQSGVTAAPGFENEELKRFKSELNLNATFSGWKRRKRDSRSARALLALKHLDQDHEFSRLLEMSADHENPIKSFEFNLGLSSEVSQVTSLFLELSVPAYIDSLIGGIRRKVNELSDFSVTGTVDF